MCVRRIASRSLTETPCAARPARNAGSVDSGPGSITASAEGLRNRQAAMACGRPRKFTSIGIVSAAKSFMYKPPSSIVACALRQGQTQLHGRGEANWCGWSESNRQWGKSPADFKPAAYANFATAAPRHAATTAYHALEARLELLLERLRNRGLQRGAELGALRGEIEDVNRFLSLGVNQGDFDVAAERGESRTNLVKQAGAILRNDFEQRAVGRAGVVKAHLRRDANFGGTLSAGSNAAAQQRLERLPGGDHVREILAETMNFGGIELERVVEILEVKRVKNNACSIAVGVGLDDVHAPRRQRAGNRGEQRRAIGSDQRQLEEAAMMLQLDLHGALRQAE